MPAPPSSTDDTAATVPRWALWVPVLFAVGIAVYFELPVEPPPLVVGLLALVLVLLLTPVHFLLKLMLRRRWWSA